MAGLRSQVTFGVTVAMIFGWGATSAAAPTTLRWKFKEGERITYLIEEKQTTKLKADTDVFDLTQTLLLDTTWKVKAVDQNGKADIGVTIDRVRFRAEGKGDAKVIGTIDYDSRDQKEPKDENWKGRKFLNSSLAAAVGTEFTLKFDPHGRISDVTVPDTLAKALAGTAAQELAGFFGSSFTTEGIKRKLTDWVVHLPMAAVTPKEKSWTDRRPVEKLSSLALTCTYQGSEGREGDRREKIDVSPELVIQREPDKAYDKITSQEGKGVIFFDNQSGRLVEYALRHKVALQSYVVGSKYAETDAETVTTVKLGKAGVDRDDK
jgi:hypothetical protein